MAKILLFYFTIVKTSAKTFIKILPHRYCIPIDIKTLVTGQNFASFIRYEYIIFQTNTKLARKIDPRFNGDNLSGLECRLFIHRRQIWTLVYLKP